METVRARLGALVEWLVAAAFVLGALVLGSTLARDVRTAAAVAPLSANGPTATVSTAGVPPGSTSIPVLFLGNRTIRIGETADAVAAKLGATTETTPASAERNEIGERVTRVYNVAGTAFALVFQPLADDLQLRVGAIFLFP